MNNPLQHFLLSLADDELILGHRDSEWTGHAPLIEEDIAFANIAQDEIGHALGWYKIYESIAGTDPDTTAFEREAKEFLCCHLVQMPKGDWAYTVVRQYLFDTAEIIRLEYLKNSSHEGIKELAVKIFPEEQYHLLHTEGTVLRLGDATEESHRRMQAAVDRAFPEALGIFEPLDEEEKLISEKIFPGNKIMENEWLSRVIPLLKRSGLKPPVHEQNGNIAYVVTPAYGGRKKVHTEHFPALVRDMQLVYRSIPGAKW